jgi:hypothetical protein
MSEAVNLGIEKRNSEHGIPQRFMVFYVCVFLTLRRILLKDSVSNVKRSW